jgi:hypothetical protein
MSIGFVFRSRPERDEVGMERIGRLPVQSHEVQLLREERGRMLEDERLQRRYEEPLCGHALDQGRLRRRRITAEVARRAGAPVREVAGER